MGWRSVGSYYSPAASATNAAYFAKAQIQLARLLEDANRQREAEAVLRDLRSAPNVDRIYQAIALAKRYSILDSLGDAETMIGVRQQFQSLHSDLEANNPTVLRQLETIVSKRELLQLGVGDRKISPEILPSGVGGS
jgi:hypothetical protein